MLTYALFIASDPEPVSDSHGPDLEALIDRARLSSGGTIVRIRATDSDRHDADAFTIPVATFVNGLRLETRDGDGDTFTFEIDGRPTGVGRPGDGEWVLERLPEEAGGEPKRVAVHAGGDSERDEAQAQFGKLVEDWLT